MIFGMNDCWVILEEKLSERSTIVEAIENDSPSTTVVLLWVQSVPLVLCIILISHYFFPPPGKLSTLSVDTIVLCAGQEVLRELHEPLLKGTGNKQKVFLIGGE